MELDIKFWSTFGFTILNILILYFVLRKVLFGRLTQFMENRSNKIEETLANVEETKNMIEDMKREYSDKLRAARVEGQNITAEYKEMAMKEYNEIIGDAKKNAERIIFEARQELEIEKQQIMAGIKEEISELVIAASEKVIRENMNNDINKKLVKEFIDNEYIA